MSVRYRTSRPMNTSRTKADFQWARSVQERIRDEVITEDRYGRFPDLRFVAGLDVSVRRSSRLARAATAVFRYPEMILVESSVATCPIDFPYVPGFLSFRELPALIEALAALRTRPQMLLCDGQGLAHPRRCGLACHVGVETGIPSIGVAKSRLTGAFESVPTKQGEWTALTDPRQGGEVIGAVVRTRAGVKPIFVSVGHRISLPSAIRITLGCVTRYRLPETTRAADRLAAWG